jgi:hypothetical protein
MMEEESEKLMDGLGMAAAAAAAADDDDDDAAADMILTATG